MRQITIGFLTAAVVGLMSASAQADFIGIHADANAIWTNSSTSSVGNTKDKVNGFYSVAFDHPLPLIPNVKIRYSNFDLRNSNASSSDQTVETLDGLGYYRILDNIVDVYVGAGVKQVNNSLTNSIGNQIALQNITKKYNRTIPAVYAAVGGNLPFTGLSAKAEVMLGKSSSADFSDSNAEVKYDFIETPVVDFGAKAGFRNLQINTDSSNNNVKRVTFRGPYLGLEAHF